MALASTRTLSLALPLALGLACTHAHTTQARSEPTAAAPSNQDISGTAAADPLAGVSPDQIVAGRVVSVTDDSISIDQGQGQEKTLYVSPQTNVTIDGMDAAATDIEAGQDVRAAFSNQDGRDVAVKIVSGGATDKG